METNALAVKAANPEDAACDFCGEDAATWVLPNCGSCFDCLSVALAVEDGELSQPTLVYDFPNPVDGARIPCGEVLWGEVNGEWQTLAVCGEPKWTEHSHCEGVTLSHFDDRALIERQGR